MVIQNPVTNNFVSIVSRMLINYLVVGYFRGPCASREHLVWPERYVARMPLRDTRCQTATPLYRQLSNNSCPARKVLPYYSDIQ